MYTWLKCTLPASFLQEGWQQPFCPFLRLTASFLQKGGNSTRSSVRSWTQFLSLDANRRLGTGITIIISPISWVHIFLTAFVITETIQIWEFSTLENHGILLLWYTLPSYLREASRCKRRSNSESRSSRLRRTKAEEAPNEGPSRVTMRCLRSSWWQSWPSVHSSHRKAAEDDHQRNMSNNMAT
jgi:hypothetical protein